MEPREIELNTEQILMRANTVPKVRTRKISAFDQISREDDIGEVEDDYNDSIAPSTSFREISRQLSNANSEECSTITPHMSGSMLDGPMRMGGSMLDGPMRPKLVQQPVRRKSSIFRKIRDKLRRGSLVSSSTAESSRSSASATSATATGPNPNLGIAGIIQGNLLTPDFADMLFKTAAAATTAPMSVTGDHAYQEYYQDPQQRLQQQSSVNSRKKSGADDGSANKGGDGLIASTEIASELKTAFTQYAGNMDAIPAREVGYILRTLGQNPTEDEILALVCEAGCDWEGVLTADDFLTVALVSMQKQADRMDDVRAAFRAFDNNGDGTISRDELESAMQRFGHSFSKAECDEMFVQADLNADGHIDWEEFMAMMMPGDITEAQKS